MSNENGIDPKKLNEMKVKILRAEQANLRTREKTTDEMVEHIRKIITSFCSINKFLVRIVERIITFI